MCSIRRMITFALVLGILALMPISIAAEAETDWSSYDWEHFSVRDVEYDDWESMCDWFRTEADLELLFFIKGKTDASFSTDLDCILADRFFDDPQAMLYAIADEDAEKRHRIYGSIVYGADDWDELIDLLETIHLSGLNAEEEYAVLREMIEYAEAEFGVDIVNPKTGDPVVFIAAGLVLSAAGGLILIKKKKEF